MQYEAYCGIRKAREDAVRLNLVGARSLEGLGALSRLGLEGLLLFMYILTDFLVDHFTAWRAAKRFFAKFFGFLFDNTCRYYLCVCISLTPYSCLLIAAVDVINYGLE